MNQGKQRNRLKNESSKQRKNWTKDHFGDTAAVLNSTVSNSYYGMLRGQISMYSPPKHPNGLLGWTEFRMTAGSLKRSIKITLITQKSSGSDNFSRPVKTPNK